MGDGTGEAEGMGLRVAFGRRLKLEFHGATVTSDAGLLAFWELDDALGLTAMAAEVLADPRTGRNGRHSLIAQLRQSVFGRLAGYEDVNDADRLGRDPAMRWIVGGRAVTDQAASTSQMGRFETSAMTSPTNLTALADLSGRWIARAQMQRARTALVLDIDSSVKIGAKVIGHGRYAIFQMAEVAVPRELFGRLLDRIARLRPPDPAPC